MTHSGENRIDTAFRRLKEHEQRGFVAYICAGDPHLDATRELAIGLHEAGVDVLELGIPFSDPLADGIVNQMAAQRALEAGTTLAGVMKTARAIRESCPIPIVFFTYLNPVYQYGYRRFLDEAHDLGIDGLLVLDLPPDEIAACSELAEAGQLHPIRLVAPTTPADRLDTIVGSGRGFVYYVSRAGVTGEQTTLSASIGPGVTAIRQHTDLPVAVGFGISTPEQSAEVARLADAVVVGSAIVRRVAEHGQSPQLVEKVVDFVKPLVDAAHTAGQSQPKS